MTTMTEIQPDLIVSRHPAVRDWVRAAYAADIPAVETAAPADVAGKIVAGNLPLHLACLCREVWAVEFFGSAPRGAEYSLEDMCSAGAHLRRYVVYQPGELVLALDQGGYAGLPPASSLDPTGIALLRSRYRILGDLPPTVAD